MSAVKELGSRLQEARHALGRRRRRDVPKAEAARAVDVTGMTYGRWEAGELEPSLAVISGLAAFYGVRPEWLAFGTGEMRAEAVEAPAAEPPAATARATPAGGLLISPSPSIALPDPAHTTPPARRKAGGR